MTTFNTDLQDLRFVIEEQFRFDEIIAAQPDMDFSMDDLSMILGETQRFCREVLHPLQEVCESDPPRLEDGRVRLPKSFHDVYNTYYRDGWGSMSVDPKFGGQGLPQTIGLMSFEMIIAACPSFSFIPGLARAAARVIESVGSPEQVDTYCSKMFAGTWGGTMCLTEPHAGSALDKLRTIATRQEDGSYRIVGNKCFISAGDQDLTENIIHLVLARTPDAPKGTRGLSLFVVPSVREDQSPNDVTVTALEEKMGLHGSPTCGLAFGDQGDCTGYILGGEGEGLRHMFLMMNEARIAVGLQGVAIANLAYQLALEYARERVQGVPAQSMRDVNAKEVAIIEHPDVRRMLLTMKAYSEGIRSLLLGTATFFDRAAIAESEAERDRYEDLINILTPICKAYGSYRAFEVADLGIMVHGGYGYIREYKIEGLLRDVKIAAIYEGTNGIQALDLLGRKVARKGGKLFMTCVQWINELIASAKDHPVVGELAAQLSKSRDDLTGITMELGTKSRGGDLVYPILSASPYLELFGDVVVGRLLVEQALLAANRLEEDVPPRMKRFYEAKIETARFFVYQLLPRTGMLAQSIRSDDRSALNIQF